MALAVFILTACGAFPEPPLVGVIHSTAEVGGGACPLLVTGGDGSRWEVTLEPPYNISFDPDSRALVFGGRSPHRVPVSELGSRSSSQDPNRLPAAGVHPSLPLT